VNKIFPDGDDDCLICRGTGVIESVGMNPNVFCPCVLRKRGTILNNRGPVEMPIVRAFQEYSLGDCRDILAWGKRAERAMIRGPFCVNGEIKEVVTRVDYLINQKLIYSWARGTDVPLHPVSFAMMGLAVPSDLWSFSISRSHGVWTAETGHRVRPDGFRYQRFRFYGDTEILARIRLVSFLTHVEEYEKQVPGGRIAPSETRFQRLGFGAGGGYPTGGGAGGEACPGP
jgi:hypothetical protein